MSATRMCTAAVTILLVSAVPGERQAGAQQGGQGAHGTTHGTTGGSASTVVRTAPAGSATTTTGRAPVNRAGRIGRSGVRPNTLDANSGAPQPTWEMPRTVTPHWEIPDTNLVQPNQVQGNRRVRGAGAVGYGGFPGYSFVDPYAFNSDLTDDVGADQGPLPPGGDPRQQQLGPGQFSGSGQLPGSGQFAEGAPSQAGVSPDGTQGYPSRRPPYRPGEPVQASAPSDPSDGLEHPEITLVFQDGRPPKHIRSYVLTGSALLAIENGHQSRIPLSDLDIAATEERNRAAGVDFTLPGESSQ